MSDLDNYDFSFEAVFYKQSDKSSLCLVTRPTQHNTVFCDECVLCYN